VQQVGAGPGAIAMRVAELEKAVLGGEQSGAVTTRLAALEGLLAGTPTEGTPSAPLSSRVDTRALSALAALPALPGVAPAPSAGPAPVPAIGVAPAPATGVAPAPAIGVAPAPAPAPRESTPSWSMLSKACSANYGTPVGGPVCCGQLGVAGYDHSCPQDKPQCVGFIQGSMMGECY
jgi:hypothetical protein